LAKSEADFIRCVFDLRAKVLRLPIRLHAHNGFFGLSEKSGLVLGNQEYDGLIVLPVFVANLRIPAFDIRSGMAQNLDCFLRIACRDFFLPMLSLSKCLTVPPESEMF
jgi:hypothetical protein